MQVLQRIEAMAKKSGVPLLNSSVERVNKMKNPKKRKPQVRFSKGEPQQWGNQVVSQKREF